MTLFGIWTGALRSASRRSWRISLSSSDSFVLRAGVLVFFADVLRLPAIVNFASIRLHCFTVNLVAHYTVTSQAKTRHSSSTFFVKANLLDLRPIEPRILSGNDCCVFSA
jgi:hypothetical protein